MYLRLQCDGAIAKRLTKMGLRRSPTRSKLQLHGRKSPHGDKRNKDTGKT